MSTFQAYLHNWGLNRITPPLTEPVKTEDLKAHLRITTTDEDALIDTYNTAARGQCESIQRRAYIDQVWELRFSRFPLGSLPIELPRPPILLTDPPEITYTDVDGDQQTLVYNTDFVVEASSFLARVHPAPDTAWPETRLFPESVILTYHAGYGVSGDDVPAEIRQAIMLLAGHWFTHRLDAQDQKLENIPQGVLDLLAVDRVWR